MVQIGQLADNALADTLFVNGLVNPSVYKGDESIPVSIPRKPSRTALTTSATVLSFFLVVVVRLN
jgi:hypothetical protein